MWGGTGAAPALISCVLPEQHQQSANTDPNVGEPFGKGQEESKVLAATKATSVSPLLHSPALQCWKGSESDWGAAHIPRGETTLVFHQRHKSTPEHLHWQLGGGAAPSCTTHDPLQLINNY